MIAVLVFVLLSIILATANTAGDKFLELYDKMMNMPTSSGMTVIEFINKINFELFGGKLKVARTDKEIGDAYSSKQKTLIFTNETLTSDSVGSFSIVAHELGHAEQDFTSKKVKTRIILNRIGLIVGKLFLPAVITFIVLLFFDDYRIYGYVMAGVAVAIFLFAVLMKILTYSIEKDASRRAVKMLKDVLPADELKSAKKFLKSAKRTYWSEIVRLFFGWTGLIRKVKMF